MNTISYIWKMVKKSKTLYGIYLALYRIYKSLWYVLQHILEVGFDYQARSWASRDLPSIEEHWAQRNHAKRIPFTYDHLRACMPASILEIGCNCGNKLYGLSKYFPDARMAGIDINALAIDKGNEWLRHEEKENISLFHCRAEDLDTVITDSFDVVFSWASLIYIKPAMIELVLGKMLEKAIKAVVLFEMQMEVETHTWKRLGVYCKGNWKRDYPSILHGMGIAVQETSIDWIPQEIWFPGGGGAAVIKIKK